MPVTLAARPAAPSSAADLLARIAGEVRLLPGGVQVGAAVLPAGRTAEGRHAALTEALVDRYHLHGAARPTWSDAGFVRRLGDLLGSRWCWEPGWRLVDEWGDGWLVERDGLVLPVAGDEVRLTTRGIRVRFPADRPQSSAGWFVVAGTGGPAPRSGPLAECSLSLVAEAAPRVFTDLVLALDHLGVRSTARVLTDPGAYGRPDSAVVTVARADLPAVARIALGLHAGRRAAFGPAVPGFTRALAPGVAVADHPGPGPGFGRHRCAVVASGLLAAGPGAGDGERLSAVRTAFRDAGLDPDAPHLDPGSTDLALSWW